jgi:hypothetical protein
MGGSEHTLSSIEEMLDNSWHLVSAWATYLSAGEGPFVFAGKRNYYLIRVFEHGPGITNYLVTLRNIVFDSSNYKVLDSESWCTLLFLSIRIPSLGPNSFLSILFTTSGTLDWRQFTPGHGSCGPLYLNQSSGVAKTNPARSFHLPSFVFQAPTLQ